MANITNVQYSVEDGSTIRIFLDDGEIIYRPHGNAYANDYTAKVNAWVSDGNTIGPYDPYYNMTLAEVKELNQDRVDRECGSFIIAAWSGPAQSNVSMGLYDNVICELCKTEISDTLADNKVYIDTIETLTTNAEIDAYVASISRTPITGGRT